MGQSSPEAALAWDVGLASPCLLHPAGVYSAPRGPSDMEAATAPRGEAVAAHCGLAQSCHVPRPRAAGPVGRKVAMTHCRLGDRLTEWLTRARCCPVMLSVCPPPGRRAVGVHGPPALVRAHPQEGFCQGHER